MNKTSAYDRDDLKYDDGKAVHACEGARGADFDRGTFIVWTVCQKDVPANKSFVGVDDITCPVCIEKGLPHASDCGVWVKESCSCSTHQK